MSRARGTRGRRALKSKHGQLNGTNRPYRRRPRFEPLEDRRLLANVTVGNLNDVVNGKTTSIAALIATPAATASRCAKRFWRPMRTRRPTRSTFSVVTGTIQLTNVGHVGEIAINNNLTINGPGASLLTIRRSIPAPRRATARGSSTSTTAW